MSEIAPHRRWFRYSLRTLFVAVTVLCCWLGYGLNWIRQRHDALDHLHIGTYAGEAKVAWNNMTIDRLQWVHIAAARTVKSPWSIRLLGEAGVGSIAVYGPDHADLAQNLQRLFPEAEVNSAESPPRPQLDVIIELRERMLKMQNAVKNTADGSSKDVH